MLESIVIQMYLNIVGTKMITKINKYRYLFIVNFALEQ